MDTLTSLSTKVFANGNNHSKALSSPSSSSSSRAPLRRSGTFFLPSPSIGLNPLRSKAIPSVASIRHSSSGIQASARLDTLEIGNRGLERLQTVNVRFVLQKECMFGEQFLIVGDDPVIGSWDPSHAMPLNWSDEHLWTAEMEIPEDKVIQFKFILKSCSGDVSWQPGPDRILRTWKTENTIVIAEDWDDAELQKTTEEVMNQNEELINNLNEKMIVQTDERDTMGEKYTGRVEDKEALFAYGEGAPVLVPGLNHLQVMPTEEPLTQ